MNEIEEIESVIAEGDESKWINSSQSKYIKAIALSLKIIARELTK